MISSQIQKKQCLTKKWPRGKTTTTTTTTHVCEMKRNWVVSECPVTQFEFQVLQLVLWCTRRGCAWRCGTWGWGGGFCLVFVKSVVKFSRFLEIQMEIRERQWERVLLWSKVDVEKWKIPKDLRNQKSHL